MDKCPFCEIRLKENIKLHKEIDNLTERLEVKDEEYQQMMQANNEAIKDLQERLEAWREYHHERIKSWNERGDDKAYWKARMKLQDLGEI